MPTDPNPGLTEWQIESWQDAHEYSINRKPKTPAEIAAAANYPSTRHDWTKWMDSGMPNLDHGSGGGGAKATTNSAGHTGGGNNRDVIINFFRSKGVADNIIYGILGNLQVESGLNPGASNSGEGAIGIAQWEGGRRTNLENFAQNHGGSVGDLNTQLQFLWHEMNTTESGAWRHVQGATSAADAAARWDQFYERSSGEARQDRVNYAVQFSGGKGPTGSTSGLSDSAGGGGSSGGGNPTMADYQGVDSLGSLLNQVPELRHLVDKAVSGNWTTEKFQNEVENGHWWKNHSATARSVIIQKANDPSTYNQSLSNTRNTLSTLAHQLGFTLTSQQLNDIAGSAMLTGNDNNQQWMTQQLGRRQDYSHLTSTDDLQGGMAATVQQLQSLAGDYGFNWDAAQLGKHAQDILVGNTTIDTYKQRLIGWAKSAFPGLSDEIDKGATVKDLADPYVTSMSQLLEQDPGSLNVYTPLIRKAMQGSVDPSTKLRAPQSLTDFEEQVRNDPRWQYTQNSKDTMSRSLLQIGSTFGFGPTA